MPTAEASDANFIRFNKSIEHIITHPKEVASIYQTYQEIQASPNIFSWIKLIFKAAIFAVRDTSIIPLAQEYIKGNLALDDILQNEKTWDLLATHKDKVHALLTALKPDIDKSCGTEQINLPDIVDNMLKHPKELTNMYRLYNDISSLTKIQEINILYETAFPKGQDADISTKTRSLIDLYKTTQTTEVPGISNNAPLMEKIKAIHDNFNNTRQIANLSRVSNITPPAPSWLQLGTQFIDLVNKDTSLADTISLNSLPISEYVQKYYDNPEQKKLLNNMGVTDPKVLEIIAPMLSNPATLKKINDSYNQSNWLELLDTTVDFALHNSDFNNYLHQNNQNISNSVKHFLTNNPQITQDIPYGIAENNLKLFDIIEPILTHPQILKDTLDAYNTRNKDPKYPITLLVGKALELVEDPIIEKFVQDNSKHITNIIESYFEANPDQANSILKPYNLDPSLLKITDILLKHPKDLKSMVDEINKEKPNYQQIAGIVGSIAKNSPELDNFLKEPNNKTNLSRFITTISAQSGFTNTQELSSLILAQLPNLESWTGISKVATNILLNQGARTEAVNILKNNIVDYITQKNPSNIAEEQELSTIIKSALEARTSKTTTLNFKDILRDYINHNEVQPNQSKELQSGLINKRNLYNIAFDNLTIEDFAFTGSTIHAGSFKNTVFVNTDFSNTVFMAEQEKNPYTQKIEYKVTDFSGSTFDPPTLKTLISTLHASQNIASRAKISLDNIKLIGDFSGMDLSHLSFQNADFSQAKLDGVNLANCNLYKAVISVEQLQHSSNLSNVVLDESKNIKDVVLSQVINDLASKVTRNILDSNPNMSQNFANDLEKAMQPSLQNKPQFAEYLVELQQTAQNYPQFNLIESDLIQNVNLDPSSNISVATDKLIDNLFYYKIATNISSELFKGGEKLNQGRTTDTLHLARHLAQVFNELKVENPNIDFDQFIKKESSLSGHLEFNVAGQVSTSSGLTQIYYDMGTKYTKAGYLTGGIQMNDLTSPELKNTLKSYIKAEAMLESDDKNLIQNLAEKLAANISKELFKGGDKNNQGRMNDTIKLTQHLSQILYELKDQNPNINFEQLLDKESTISGHIEFNITGKVNAASGLTQIYYDRGTKYTKAGYLTGGIQMNDLTSTELKDSIKSYIEAEIMLDPEEKSLIKEVSSEVTGKIFGNKNIIDGERLTQHLMGIFTEIKMLGINIKEFIQGKKKDIVGHLPSHGGLKQPPSLTELYYQETKGALTLSLPATQITKSLSDKVKDNLIAYSNNTNLPHIEPTRLTHKGKSPSREL